MMSKASVRDIRKLPTTALPKTNDLARKIMLKLLSGIEVGSLTFTENGEHTTLGDANAVEGPHARVEIHDSRVFRRLLTGGTIGAGEAYIDGDWSSSDLTAVTRLFSANIPTMEAMKQKQAGWIKFVLKFAHFGNRNTRDGSKRNIAAHYDLGNDFFTQFLDPTMMYSSAVFPSPDASLEEASKHKLQLLCDALELKASDHLVEIGTGWGGMAIYAATHYGCRVTTTTISQEQFLYTQAKVAELGLDDRITVLCDDYRDLKGRFDKLVSVEMIEAVGHQFYDSYFGCVSDLLKPNGKAVIQAITIPDQRYESARDSVDFIKRYIFPGGCLPSLGVIHDSVGRCTDLQVIDLRDIALDYARTLEKWHEAFLAKREQIQAIGFDDRFERMWRYYLSYCEGGFRERIIGTFQITLAKPLYRPAS
jgi:cyclopropane-fatty-acyl-phospholipid synthase